MQLIARGRWVGQYYIVLQFYSKNQNYIGGASRHVIPQFYFIKSPYDIILDNRT